MKVIEQHLFEEGDVFEGVDEDGGYIDPNRAMRVSLHRYIFVSSIGINSVQVCGDGTMYNFMPEALAKHVSNGNIKYLGNVKKGKI